MDKRLIYRTLFTLGLIRTGDRNYLVYILAWYKARFYSSWLKYMALAIVSIYPGVHYVLKLASFCTTGLGAILSNPKSDRNYPVLPYHSFFLARMCCLYYWPRPTLICGGSFSHSCTAETIVLCAQAIHLLSVLCHSCIGVGTQSKLRGHLRAWVCIKWTRLAHMF